jgi:hypothetical protein
MALPGGKRRTSAKALVNVPGRKSRAAVPVETIEARLDRKAVVADTQTCSTPSLGQMSVEQRHKLLYRD